MTLLVYLGMNDIQESEQFLNNLRKNSTRATVNTNKIGKGKGTLA